MDEVERRRKLWQTHLQFMINLSILGSEYSHDYNTKTWGKKYLDVVVVIAVSQPAHLQPPTLGTQKRSTARYDVSCASIQRRCVNPRSAFDAWKRFIKLCPPPSFNRFTSSGWNYVIVTSHRYCRPWMSDVHPRGVCGQLTSGALWRSTGVLTYKDFMGPINNKNKWEPV